MKTLFVSLSALILLSFSALFAQWNIQTVDNSGDVGKWSDIAYDSHGYPHIVYFDDTDDDLMYAHWTGSAWKIEEITYSMGNYGCAIAVDNQDYVHIVLTPSTTIRYYNNISGSFKTVGFQSGSSSRGRFPDICLHYNQSTGQTTPHISWYDHGTKDLYHAYLDHNTNRLVSEPVDQGNDVGLNSHITCDSNENIYISYYDQGAGALKFAYYDGTKWSTTTIDDNGDVGLYNSIALDNNTKPCISYYDVSNGNLKYVVIENVNSKK